MKLLSIKKDPIITRAEVAKLLRVSTRTVHRLEQRGQLQVINLSIQTPRYRLSTVDAFLRRNAPSQA